MSPRYDERRLHRDVPTGVVVMPTPMCSDGATGGPRCSMAARGVSLRECGGAAAVGLWQWLASHQESETLYGHHTV